MMSLATINPFPEKFCHTSSKIIRFSYMWTIDSFSFYPSEDDYGLDSATFTSGTNEELKFCLRVHPKNTTHSLDYTSVFLKLVYSDQVDACVKFRISILNEKREIVKTRNSSAAYRFRKNWLAQKWGFAKFIRRDFLLDEANGMLPNDKLTLYCEAEVLVDPVTIAGQASNQQLKVPECSLGAELGTLLENGMHYDVTLSAGGREVRAHKAILSARSPVFKAMFQNQMLELQQNRVEITEINLDVLLEMLRFIYSGMAPNVNRMTGELLKAADKYDLTRLTALCAESLRANLSVENATEVLLLADLHCLEQLKTGTILFVTTHFSAIMKTPAWKSLLFSHPSLVAETFRTFADHQQSALPSPKRVRLS